MEPTLLDKPVTIPKLGVVPYVKKKLGSLLTIEFTVKKETLSSGLYILLLHLRTITAVRALNSFTAQWCFK